MASAFSATAVNHSTASATIFEILPHTLELHPALKSIQIPLAETHNSNVYSVHIKFDAAPPIPAMSSNKSEEAGPGVNLVEWSRTALLKAIMRVIMAEGQHPERLSIAKYSTTQLLGEPAARRPCLAGRAICRACRNLLTPPPRTSA